MERQEERQRRIPMPPPAELPLNVALEAEAPFLRPKHRTRIVKRAHRGLAGRALLALRGGVLALLLGSVLWAGYSKAMASERLKVAHVDVHGGNFLSEGEVRELLGPAVGENILSLDIDALKSRLRSSPWVADATVRRTLPDTLSVEIRERVPLALAEADGLYLMDEEGTLIDLYGPRTSGFDLPIVRGLAGATGEARRDRAQRAGALLSDLRELGSEVSEVRVEDSGDLRVVLRGRGEVVKLGSPPYHKPFETFLRLRGELAERAPAAEYFDLRFRDRIYAKEPASAASGASTPAHATSAPAAQGR